MTFAEALAALQAGQKVSRPSGPVLVGLVAMSNPVVAIEKGGGEYHFTLNDPWAVDWKVVL